MVYKTLIFLLAHLIISFFYVHAQDPMNQIVHEWYLEERFIIADQNDDALLDIHELKRFPKEFSYYLADRHYDLSDVNKDGHLSFNELYKRTHSEYKYRYNMERRQLNDLLTQYPALAEADETYLKKTPALVILLFENLFWLVEYSELAAKIYTDKDWTSQHPDVLLALHKNLRWMTANPTKAKSLYKNRNMTRQLPELLGWRADHQAFMRMHPVLNKFYGIDFLPR